MNGRWLPFLLVPAVLLLAAGRFAWNPHCPFLAFTGWHCPGCGGTRALLAALRGDILLSLSLNALALPLAALAVYFLLLPSARGILGWEGFPLLRGRGFHRVLVLVVLVFLLLRNLSGLPAPP